MLLLLQTLERFCEDCHGCLPSVGAAVVGITSLKPLLPLLRSQLLLSVKLSNEAVCVSSELFGAFAAPATWLRTPSGPWTMSSHMPTATLC